MQYNNTCTLYTIHSYDLKELKDYLVKTLKKTRKEANRIFAMKNFTKLNKFERIETTNPETIFFIEKYSRTGLNKSI